MAEDDGEERESLVKTDSMESRWVYQLDDESEIEDDDDDEDENDDEVSELKIGIDSEDEDVVAHRLIRTGPRVDSFDVEALDVPGTHRHDFEVHFSLSSMLIFLCFSR